MPAYKMVNEPETTVLLCMHRDLDALAASRNGWPEEAMTNLTIALRVIGRAIINAPVTCERDVANKFRFAADLIDAESGQMVAENDAVNAAVNGLADLRDAQWTELMRGAGR